MGKPASTRLTDRMIPALCNGECRIRAAMKRKGGAGRGSNQTNAMNRLYESVQKLALGVRLERALFSARAAQAVC